MTEETETKPMDQVTVTRRDGGLPGMEFTDPPRPVMAPSPLAVAAPKAPVAAQVPDDR